MINGFWSHVKSIVCDLMGIYNLCKYIECCEFDIRCCRHFDIEAVAILFVAVLVCWRFDRYHLSLLEVLTYSRLKLVVVWTKLESNARSQV